MNLFFGNCQVKSFVPSLSVSSNSATINPAGGSVEITVTCNEAWTISISQSGVWFSVSPEGGSAGTTTMTINGESNTDPLSRTAIITIESASGLYESIEVYQNPEV
jgi:hypothetical protein